MVYIGYICLFFYLFPFYIELVEHWNSIGCIVVFMRVLGCSSFLVPVFFRLEQMVNWNVPVFWNTKLEQILEHKSTVVRRVECAPCFPDESSRV